MPLFISEAEFEAAGVDVGFITERADAYIRDLLNQLEAQKARADAAAITSEQRCAVVEQKFLAMSSQFKLMESEKNQLEQTLQRRSTELAQVQGQVHKLELEMVKHDSDRERGLCELNETKKAKRELLEIVEQKNAELAEKSTQIKAYLDKIVFLTDERSTLEGKVREAEAELTRSQAVQARLSQGKELLEQHNKWLNEELTDKVDTLLKERRASSDLEAELRSKLARAEQTCKELGESLHRNKEQAKELELRLSQVREELISSKQEAASKEDHLSLEVETATKLAELYKQSSEEWSKKAVDLEGVIKALEVHLSQVEADFKEQLEKEIEGRKASEKKALDAEESVEKLKKELDLLKRSKERDSVFVISSFSDEASRELNLSEQQLSLELHEDRSPLPMITSEISGTALANALLRDGWSLTKVYVKYQEAVDAWRHERQERRQSQALLQRVLQEIEQRAEVIMDERAEHARMVEAYTVMEEKLHLSVEEQTALESQIRELKAELRKRERDLKSAKQDCLDLQSEVAVLLKECADIKQRAGTRERALIKGAVEGLEPNPAATASDAVISERLLTFKDIHDLVEQNTQLRAVARALGQQSEERERELKEAFDLELQKRMNEATRKVSAVVRKSEEQMQLITSLQGTVAMYRRLYEESRSILPMANGNLGVASDVSGNDLRGLVAQSQEDLDKVRKEALEQISQLESDLNKARQDANATRAERDRLIIEATFAREQLQTIVKESENQRKEMDAVLARNVEFSQIITDYQRRLRENAEHVHEVEEKARRLSVEVTVLEREKELLSSAEKRASQELSSLSDRVHRLQATLDSTSAVEEAHESMRTAEKKKLEDEVNKLQKEWVGMKHELDAERAHTRHVSHERDQMVKQAMDRIESFSKDLADSVQKVSVAETRANLAEARCTELEAALKKAEERTRIISSQGKGLQGTGADPAEILSSLEQAREEIDQLKEELNASKNHVDQYKRLAQMNEEALLCMEEAHNRFKEESENTRKHLEAELSSLREKAVDLEKQLTDKENELAAAIAHTELVLTAAEKDIMLLRQSDAGKSTQLDQADEHIKALKGELDKEHQQWRSAQANYERQVLLQADTIRELTSASERNEALQKEILELRARAELSTADLASSRVAWDMERAALSSENESLLSKVKELEEQNKILLDRLEVSQGLALEHGKGLGSELKASENVGNDLQEVVHYLRRSKEALDVEISLLKQERLRLQKQLEAALRSADEARADLRRVEENARSTLCSEEEFQSLQLQVREMTLLRESNTQLRLENKRNFEECQRLHEKLQKGQEELETLKKSLREREVELEATVKDVDMQKAEVSRWESRVSQLLQKYKTVDVEDHQRVQSELASTQEALQQLQAALDTSQGEVRNLQEAINTFKQEASVKDERTAELEKKLRESEVFVRTEVEKARKQSVFYKRKFEASVKERDEARDNLQKQVDELKSSGNKRGVADMHKSEVQIRQEVAAHHEQLQKEMDNLLKEKDSRIQILEKTLDREREDLRKEREVSRAEKARRIKEKTIYFETVQKRSAERQQLMDELNALRREKESFSENVQSKKFGRKIVRPKIDSPVESQIQAEPSEMGNDAALEAIEVDTDARDDARLAISETVESVNTTSSIVAVSSTTPSVDDGLLTARKRPPGQLIEEPFVGVGSLVEAIPANKRQKGTEVDTLPTATTTSIEETLVTVEATKVPEVDVEAPAPIDLTRVETHQSYASEVVPVPETIEYNQSHQAPVPSVERSAAPRRPRIVRSDPYQAPSPVAYRDAATMSLENEPTAQTEGDLLLEGPSTAGYRQEVEVQGSPLRTEEDRTDLNEQGHGTSDTAVAASRDTSEIEDTENLMIILTEAPETSAAPSEPGFSVSAAVHETTLESLRLAEGLTVEAVMAEAGLDVEDGEIEPDEPSEPNAETSLGDVANEDTQGGNDDDEKDTEPLVETCPDEKVQVNNEAPQGGNTDAGEGSTVDHKAEEVPAVRTRSQIMTRQSGRGSALSIRERLLSKRSGQLPPSPGKRNPRGTKRSIGVQRGRTNSPERDSADESGKQEAPEQDSQSAPNNADTAKEEQ